MTEMFDQEFKLYLHDRGVNIDSSLFELQFEPPQNFAASRQSELDTARAPTYQSMSQVPTISKRFALKRFLGLTDEEIAENERMWAEENGKAKSQASDSSSELRGAGVSQAGITSDLTGMADPSMPLPGGAPGEGAPPEGAAMSPLGGAPAPAAPAAPA
jgi:hypothetical protein